MVSPPTPNTPGQIEAELERQGYTTAMATHGGCGCDPPIE